MAEQRTIRIITTVQIISDVPWPDAYGDVNGHISLEQALMEEKNMASPEVISNFIEELYNIDNYDLVDEGTMWAGEPTPGHLEYRRRVFVKPQS